MQYRRANIPGACYFFTVNLAERNKTLLIDYIDELRAAFAKIKQNHPFTIKAMVVLPDHLHTLWHLPDNDADFPTRWRLIKSAFSHALPRTERISTSRRKKGERGIWRRRYWEHLIKDDKDFARHVDYIHYNPVKQGYVQSPADWPYLSIHHYIQKGVIQPDWAVTDDFDDRFGEL